MPALVVSGALGGVFAAAPKKHPKRPAVPGELLVGFKAGVSDAEEDAALADAGVSEKKRFKRSRREWRRRGRTAWKRR